MSRETAASRQRRYRARRRMGRTPITIDVDLFEVGELLVEKGLLQQWDCDDREKVRRALEEAVSMWGRYAVTG